MPSQWFGISLLAQFITCVTLLATTNSKSYKQKLFEIQSAYLGSKFISNEEPVLNLDSANDVFFNRSTPAIAWRWKWIYKLLLPIIIAVNILLHHIFIFNN